LENTLNSSNLINKWIFTKKDNNWLSYIFETIHKHGVSQKIIDKNYGRDTELYFCIENSPKKLVISIYKKKRKLKMIAEENLTELFHLKKIKYF